MNLEIFWRQVLIKFKAGQNWALKLQNLHGPLPLNTLRSLNQKWFHRDESILPRAKPRFLKKSSASALLLTWAVFQQQSSSQAPNNHSVKPADEHPWEGRISIYTWKWKNCTGTCGILWEKGQEPWSAPWHWCPTKTSPSQFSVLWLWSASLPCSITALTSTDNSKTL